MNPLDIPSFPLQGQSLIEASAGTGKTFTISALYNRLMLGHGRARLSCDQILVVTFTKAATEELRGRIRQRIADSFSDLLWLKNGQACNDLSLQRFIDDLAQGRTQAEVLDELEPWLQANLALMDEASIFTIHGFCQRVLQRFAFDTGVMFSADMTLDSDQYLQQACEDIWRQVAYGLDAAQSACLLRSYSGPEDLFKKVKSRLNQPNLDVRPASKSADFNAVWQPFLQAFMAAQQQAVATTEAEIIDLIRQSDVDKRSYREDWLVGWTAKNFAYLQATPSLAAPSCLERFTPTLLLDKSKSGNWPHHPLFLAVEALQAAQQPLQNFLNAAWLEPIKKRFFELLDRAGALTPNDLLRLLHLALNGPQGTALAEQIRTLYPFAMIDEFQDTDSLQYEIFNQIYPAQSVENSSTGLIMIGDPKQAIYSFRGADIFTYIKAKQALPASHLFTLDTNFRSHTELVDGVNQLFSNHPAPFVYAQDIPFYPVQAAGKHDAEALRVQGQPQVPLQLWYDGVEYTAQQARKTAATQCAEQIAALLQGTATLGTKPVVAKDIVVLVRSRKQAGWVRDALQKQGVSSVFLTHDSVFRSPEALDLFRWLQAIAQPQDERLLRASLASELYQHRAIDLAQYLTDEQAWEEALTQQLHYHTLWRKRGVMAAIMHWLESADLAVRLRQHPDGERRLTNLMHLGDLLQQTSRRLQGHEALLRWFGERVFDDAYSGEDAQLRLESDADLVAIVTIHKSKGLQYPLVFLPYLWADSNLPHANSDTIYFDEQQGRVVLQLNPSDDERHLANQAATAENLRLLYVALTRAVQGCFVWLLDAVDGRSVKEKKSAIGGSALGYVLGLETNPNWQGLRNTLASTALELCAPPQWRGVSQAQPNVAVKLPEARTIQARAVDYWRVSSYSQLIAAAANASPETSVSLHDDEQAVALISAPNSVAATAVTVEFDAQHLALTFVKGAQAGNALHDILEHWDFHSSEHLPTLCQNTLSYYGLVITEAQWPQLVAWLQACVATPLHSAHGDRFCLAAVAPAQRLSEMEFHLPIQGLKTHRLEQLLGISQRFSFQPLSGYLKGFIDLIFEHNGRYYVADYKSNHLGMLLENYCEPALTAAMQEHAYDLQAWIYTLALDALLARRLPNYVPEQHLGGVFYLFLRGMHLGAVAPLVTTATGVAQAPGVYYQAFAGKELEQWRQAFFAEGQHS